MHDKQHNLQLPHQPPCTYAGLMQMLQLCK